MIVAVNHGPTRRRPYFGGGLLALVWAMAEGALAVTGSIWALAFAQRHLNRTGPWRRAWARSSYLALMLQGPVLVGLALARSGPST